MKFSGLAALAGAFATSLALWPPCGPRGVATAGLRDDSRAGSPGAANPVLCDDPAPPLDDPLFPKQWHLFSPEDPIRGKPGAINAVGAWKSVRPAAPVVVALLDAGVNWHHPDLAANIWENPGEVGMDANMNPKQFNGVDDDGNGYVDDYHGWDFASDDYNPNSEPEETNNDHGTGMAGIMAAVPGNGIGLAGVGRNIRVMPLRVIGDFKAVPIRTFPAAIRYAVKNRARVVVTMSMPKELAESPDFLGALEEAGREGVLFVCAHHGGDRDRYFAPLAKRPNVLVVGAAGIDGRLRGDLVGLESIGVVAPGESIESTNFGGYASGSSVTGGGGVSTSAAAAVAAAAAATLLSQEPGLTPSQVKERMQKTARRVPSMEKTSGGLIDMAAMLATRGK